MTHSFPTRRSSDLDLKTIPVTCTARLVTGAGVEAEDILRNLRVEGPLFLQNNRLFSDRLAVRSDKVNGRGGLTLDLRTGIYAVMLDGKLDRYLIPGIGIVDVETRLKVVPGAPRGSMLTGTRSEEHTSELQSLMRISSAVFCLQ